MRDIIVLGGSSHPNLVRSICRNLTIEQAMVDSKKFSNGETSIEIRDSVREKDVFIIQSGCGAVNDNFIELLIMIAACKTASAQRVTAIIPYFPYSRQPDVPHAASATGAPSISTTKEQYTFESAPATPRPLSRNDDAAPVDNVSPQDLLNRAAVNNAAEQQHGSIKQPIPVTSADAAASQSNNNNNNNSTLPPVDVYGKTESGYKQWIAQNGTLIANLLTTAGADRCITMDLHDAQFQGFFNIPVDNLYSKPLLKHYIIDYVPNYQDAVIVSPDSGGAKRAIAIADALGCSFALIHKERRAKLPKSPPSTAASSSGPNHGSIPAGRRPLSLISGGSIGMSSSSSVNTLANSANGNTTMVATTMLVGDVKDRVCVLVDDLVDTSYTITRAAKLLKDQGARYVYALVTHGVFSGDAINRINKSAIDKIITTNSVPQQEHVAQMPRDKIEVLDVSRILAEAIRRIHNGESVSMLFDHGW